MESWSPERIRYLFAQLELKVNYRVEACSVLIWFSSLLICHLSSIPFVFVSFTSLSPSLTLSFTFFPLFPLWYLPLLHCSSFLTCAWKSFGPVPVDSGERPVAVAAPAEARLPVAAGGGRRARKHHHVRWWGRRGGWHGGLWYRRASECSTQLPFTGLPHPGQQEHVSSLFTCLLPSKHAAGKFLLTQKQIYPFGTKAFIPIQNWTDPLE